MDHVTNATRFPAAAVVRRWPARGVALAVALALAVLLVACSGGKSKKQETPTVEGTATVAVTPTPGVNAGLKTPIAFSQGDLLTSEDLAGRGTGVPGRGEFTGERLIVASLGIDAPFSYKVVPPDGQMPNPDGPEDVAYYDFSQFQALGGLPGKGGNVVVAGHVDYIRYGPAVFWRLHELKAGDTVTVRMADGTTYDYKIEFNKVLDPDGADWTTLVAATADESITLITCTGEFEAGHYSNRQVAWGRRV